MRRINITKQEIVKPKALIYGLSLRQMIIMGVGFIVSLGTFALLYFICHLNIDIVFFIIFFILAIFAMGSIVIINGISGLSWIIMVFKGPITKNYQSEGLNDFYDKKKKK